MMEDDNESCFLSPVKSSSRPVEPLSSSKKPIKKWVGHHCYKILSAISKSAEAEKVKIKKEQVARIKTAFREFFAMIPYDMQSIRNKRNDPNNYTKEFYYALFYSLSRCLERCATGESDGVSKIKVLKEKGKQPGVIYIPLEHNDKVFVIQFCVCDEYQLKARKYLHNDESSASIYVTVSLNAKGKYSGVRVESQSDVNLSSSLRIDLDKPIAINQKELRKLDNSQDVYATAIEAIISGNDASSFKNLLARDLVDIKGLTKTLGFDLRPSCEHCYHCLLADVLMFALASTVISEVHTYNGRIDIKLECEQGGVIIFELKHLGTVDDAFEQIDDRKYAMGICAPIIKVVGVNLTESFEVEVEVRNHEKKALTNKDLKRKKTEKRKRDESGNDEKEAFEKKRRKFN